MSTTYRLGYCPGFVPYYSCFCFFFFFFFFLFFSFLYALIQCVGDSSNNNSQRGNDSFPLFLQEHFLSFLCLDALI